MSPSCSAWRRRFFPVGLIRSPMMTGSFPSSTIRDREAITVPEAGVIRGGTMFPTISRSVRMYSGVVPQQPPMMRSPFGTSAAICSENSSGITL